MRLSAALIVRDEERFLDGCLRSLDGHVDEVVVVDTGSTDGSMEIARTHGVVLAERPWDDDFSAARNTALDLATGDWILYIDADERFSVQGDLRRVLDDPVAVAALVRFRNRQCLTRYWETRLFRNRPDIRFIGRIHETMVPAIRGIVDAGEGRIVEAPASIDHLGYEGDLSHKHRRDIPLLEAQLEQDGWRTYLWYTLGLARQGLGDDAGAEAAWESAITALHDLGRRVAIDVLAPAELALLRLRRGDDASELVDLLQEWFPDDVLTWWATANQCLHDRAWADALAPLERLVAIDPDELVHAVLAYDRQIFTLLAPHALGVCWFQLGDQAQAAAWFRRAEAADPTSVELRTKRVLAERLAGVG